MVEGLLVIKETTGIYKGCVIGKHLEHKLDRGKANRDTCILGLIHSDACHIHEWIKVSSYFY